MNTLDPVRTTSVAEARGDHETADPNPDWDARARAVDRQVDSIRRAIRAAGGDREAAITAGHRALARSIAGF
jgi:hypothetical protein